MAKPLVVQMAHEVLDLYEENERLRRQVADLEGYQQKYLDELQRGIDNSGQMLGSWLGAILDPDSRLSRMLALEAVASDPSATVGKGRP